MGCAVTGLTRADYSPGAHLPDPTRVDSLAAVLRVHSVHVPCCHGLVIHTVADMTRDQYSQAVGVFENARVDSLTLATPEAGCAARNGADWVLYFDWVYAELSHTSRRRYSETGQPWCKK